MMPNPKKNSNSSFGLFSNMKLNDIIGPVLFISSFHERQQLRFPSFGKKYGSDEAVEKSAVLNLAGRLNQNKDGSYYYDEKGGRTEDTLVKIFLNAHNRMIDKAAKLKVKFNAPKIGGVFGPDFTNFGTMVYAKGQVSVADFSYGNYKRLYEFLTQIDESKLVVTPFVTPIFFEKKMSDKKSNFTGDFYEVINPFTLDNEAINNITKLLSAQFFNCFTVHPEDMPAVRDYVKQEIENSLFGEPDFSNPPMYRPYPDTKTGDLFFVSSKTVEAPVKLNVYEAGLDEAIVNKIVQDYRPCYEFMPSNDLSLLGGYYTEENGLRTGITLAEIEKEFSGSFEGDLPVLKNTKVVHYTRGKLVSDIFNPYAHNPKTLEPLLPDADVLFNEVKASGLPVRDSSGNTFNMPDEEIDFKEYFKSGSKKDSNFKADGI